jgi:hypothetical protein
MSDISPGFAQLCYAITARDIAKRRMRAEKTAIGGWFTAITVRRGPARSVLCTLLPLPSNRPCGLGLQWARALYENFFGPSGDVCASLPVLLQLVLFSDDSGRGGVENYRRGVAP